ncbi:MAG TPA: helix-turn-helix transcriptional regulator [Candidatus Xenobia bacterium]|jgi:transcriptional regulator with XRE-family HTH domain
MDTPEVFSQSVRQAFGLELKRLRETAGLTQEEMADKCSIHWTHVSRLERGERSIGLQTLFKFAVALGMKPHQLVEILEKLA